MAEQARRAVAGTSHAVSGGKIGGPFQVRKGDAEYIEHRIKLFDQWFKEHEADLAAKAGAAIKITLPDGAVKEGVAFKTSPMDIASGISKGLANAIIIAKVQYAEKRVEEGLADADGDEEEEHAGCCGGEEEAELWDLNRPLEGDCKLWLLKFDDPEGKNVFWHSSAHVLGQALEREFGAHLTIGPALTSGFYYDSYLGDTALNQDCFPALVSQAETIAKENQNFQRLVISKEKALELFKHNPFKVALISSKIPEGGKTTCYRCGPFVDLCKGPHVPTTAKVKAFSVLKNSSAYWLGKAENDSLQRIYGIAFPDKKMLQEHLRLLEEAKKRDHRVVGAAQDLFFFETAVSPGSCFWLGDGAKIYNKLCEFIRTEYRIRGFQEVISPNIYHCDLWKTSGHYQKYKDNMYCFDVEGAEWGLKPMNCPGHCIMFRHMNASYRQLPVRMADFGVLHRNEISGSLTGLTRVRRFQQDDAHIFCMMEQVKGEVIAALDFLFFVYSVFGFQYELKLSTRPENKLGDDALWDKAEAALQEALEETGKPWTLNVGDGAFYGPKIDIRLWDALKRPHQCGTIQLDFQLPIRFGLSYKTDEITSKEKENVAPPAEEKKEKEQEPADAKAANPPAAAADAAAAKGPSKEFVWKETPLKPGHQRPVIIHRAVLGSVERMAAILTEHYGGKWPFWVSPRQAIVCPISEKSAHYGQWVRDTLFSHGYNVAFDGSDHTISKKIREAQLQQYNYILVVGEQEVEKRKVTVRVREDPKQQEQKSVEEILEMFSAQNMPSSKKMGQIVPYAPLAQ
uniref:threonine--tRNA ligase n=1 Tax=Chromera velia CCMP2878 TaxID=1169474 RepID=A0A0G4I6R3_9ALVE|mmetsp:Transcript_8998/g.17595  ORF Transcript_8998/g.17595 Transcript_8998/m.17595 type:complete len:796 (-) Transcript_8998:117-2504(-)|eukprot:Cvel_11445.t1-p1 / transcript=Cvel_11445.t1 / gene=Cvel_11445 / organism=Chromera_velia_CCMP2878 / gene_product=Threonine--tRNA ligase, cytoplasmic, putative / transcript_product=Threonine--tRNA ligase, cytoplasmic, putative / location=Cvel_scaffold720:10105-14838(+) / protein_length=795 / sequence_SO=supercontig / SO=protein_coding / is_pseudo=false